MTFNIENYPKSYGSVKKGDFRLKDYLNSSDSDLDKLQHDLADFCFNYADHTDPVKRYKNYEYIDSGWEWSVFKKDEHTVIKIPSGIFPEVNEPVYLTNSQESYEKVLQSYPSNFVAKARFYREAGINVIEQEYVKGKSEYVLDFSIENKRLLENFRIFLESTLKLAQTNDWLPDYWFSSQENGVLIRNVILEDETDIFKVIDFTQYFDPSRMYPKLTEQVLYKQYARIQELLTWIESQLKIIKSA